MSRAATDWAWSQSIKPATHKLILLSMADRADEYHCCYPSIARLEKDTGLDRKTIQKGVAAMIKNGLITDTGKRTGATNQVRVLRLNISAESSQKRDGLTADKQPKNGNVTENGNNPKNGMRNDPNFGMCNDPKNGIQNQSIEPPIEPLPPSGVSAHAREDATPCPAKAKRKKPKAFDDWAALEALGVERKYYDGWMKARRLKKSVVPLTEAAFEGFLREAEKVGLSVPEAVQMCAEKSWAGINSKWECFQHNKAGLPSGMKNWHDIGAVDHSGENPDPDDIPWLRDEEVA